MSPVVVWETLEQKATTVMVDRAIRRCKRGRAQGPGEFPNDFYQDFKDELVQALVTLFNSHPLRKLNHAVERPG